MKSIVSEKGQVTIPKRLRERLGIRPGQALEFFEEQGRLVATKTPTEDALERVHGILRLEATTDELLQRLRGEADAL